MRPLVVLVVAILLPGCSTPAGSGEELPVTRTFSFDLDGAGSQSRAFDVPSGASHVTVEVAAGAGADGWTATLRAPAGSESTCERPADAAAPDVDTCRLSGSAESGAWTLLVSSDRPARLDAVVTVR